MDNTKAVSYNVLRINYIVGCYNTIHFTKQYLRRVFTKLLESDKDFSLKVFSNFDELSPSKAAVSSVERLSFGVFNSISVLLAQV